MTTLRLYDTTLRDGTQREGMSLSVEDKVKIACALDRLGVSYIEGGWPGSNPKDAEFFRRIREVSLARRLCAERGMAIGSDGVQMLGGHGYVKDHPVERWYRDLRAAGLMEGALIV